LYDPSESRADGFGRAIGRANILADSDIRALVVVAHPDDEVLWAGGTMLMFPEWSWKVISLCRGDDWERRARFFSVMTFLGADGSLASLDDGPDQHPLEQRHVENTILSELQSREFDLVITHSLFGEYTRHLRHEETGRAILSLWQKDALITRELWMFAYSDRQRTRYPRAIEGAHLDIALPTDIWQKKREIICGIYGFSRNSWEAMTTPVREAFWRFKTTGEALMWRQQQEARPTEDATRPPIGEQNESTRLI